MAPFSTFVTCLVPDAKSGTRPCSMTHRSTDYTEFFFFICCVLLQKKESELEIIWQSARCTLAQSGCLFSIDLERKLVSNFYEYWI